jgi:signal transduction histidine kinase
MIISSSTFTGKEGKPVFSEQRLTRLGQAALALQNLSPQVDIPAAHDIDLLLRGVVDTFHNELKYPNCQVFLANQIGTELEFKYGRGRLIEQATRANQNKTWRPRLGEEGLQGNEGLIGWVGSSLKPVNLPDVEASVGFFKPLLEIKVRSELTVPMVAQNELIGVIDIQSEESHAFDNLDLEIVNFFARQIAGMVQAANLSRLMAQSVRHLGNLALGGSKITTARTLPEIGEAILTNAIRALNAHSGSIWWANEPAQQLHLLATLNLPDWFNDNNLNFRPLINNILNNRVPVFISSLEKYQEGLEAIAPLRASGIEAFCCLPLQGQDEVLGALILNYQEPHKFSQTELHTATILADQAASALQNVRNLSAIKRLEKQLVRSEQLGNLGQLASGITHDFNNLLASILGLSEVLLNKNDNPDEQHLLEMLRQSALDGAQMIRQLQSIGSGKRENRSGPVEIEKLIQEVIELTRSRWSNDGQLQNILTEFELEADPLPPFKGNPTELREVFTNLILNAVDAMPQGGKLGIKIQRHRKEVWISIRDSGSGMTEETRRHLFEPFFTTKAPDDHAHGLGLSVSQGIIARHEGSIQVESKLNEGSCFIVKLPLKPAAPPAAPAKINPPVSPLRVLVVDDDPKLLYILKRILEIDRHEVTISSGGLEAVRLFTSQPDGFDLILTDIQMKDLNGWEIAQAVRVLRPDLPLIVITGGAADLQPEKLQQYAITEVVTKPYSLDDMQSLLRKLAKPAH